MAITHGPDAPAVRARAGGHSRPVLASYSSFTQYLSRTKFQKVLWSAYPSWPPSARCVLWLIYSMGTFNFTKIAQLPITSSGRSPCRRYSRPARSCCCSCHRAPVRVRGRPSFGLWQEPGRVSLQRRGKPGRLKATPKRRRSTKTADLAWMIGALILTKNEWIHILSFSTLCRAGSTPTSWTWPSCSPGFGMYALLAAIDFRPLLEGSEPEPDGRPTGRLREIRFKLLHTEASHG